MIGGLEFRVTLAPDHPCGDGCGHRTPRSAQGRALLIAHQDDIFSWVVADDMMTKEIL